MALRICLGKYARKGYEPEHMGIKVYSVEELCFFIKENAFFIDETFVNTSLGEWLEKECELKELGEELNRAAKRGSKVVEFISILLDYAGFFCREETEEIKQLLLANSSRSVFQKRKARADVLVNKGSYAAALRIYKDLLSELPEEENKLEGELYHGCGVCLSKLFYFTKAGQEFLRAYEITGQLKSYRQYLWTKRLSMDEKEFLEFLKKHKEAYEDSVEITEILEEYRREWNYSSTGLLAEGIRSKKEEYQITEYQKLLKDRVEYLKDNYLEIVK